MTDRLAAVGLRLLAPCSALLGTADPDALQNLNTTLLPDGSLVWVQDQFALYVLNKTSTAVPSGTTVVAPGSGPGRWQPASSSSGGLTPPQNPADDGKVALASGGNLVYLPGGAANEVLTWNGAAWVSSPSGGAGAPIVTDLAALAAVAAPADGTTAYVLSLRTSFSFGLGSALAADGITIVADTGATGKWLRNTLPGLPWIEQFTWYIDAVGGDDENVGSTNITALATHAELERRISGATFASTVTVNIISDLAEVCQLSASFTGSAILHYIGGVSSTDHTGTLTNFSSQDPTDAANLGNLATEAGGFNWTPYFNKRLYFPDADEYSWVMSIPTGSGNEVARIVEPSSFDIDNAGNTSLNAFAIPGNSAYEVQSLFTVLGFKLDVTQGNRNGSTSVSAIIQDLDVIEANDPLGLQLTAAAESPILIVRCRAAQNFSNGSSVKFFQSFLYGGVPRTAENPSRFDMQGSGSNIAFAFSNGTRNSMNGCTFNSEIRVIDGAHLSIGFCQAFNGNGLTLEAGCFVDCSGAFGGRDNSGFGITVESGALVTYNALVKPVATGATNDTKIAGVATAYASIPAFNVGGLTAAGIIVKA